MHNFGQQVSRSGDLPGCLDGVGHALLPSAWGGAGAAYEKTGSTWCLYICSKILYSSGEIFACKHCAILLQWKNHCGIQTSGPYQDPNDFAALLYLEQAHHSGTTLPRKRGICQLHDGSSLQTLCDIRVGNKKKVVPRISCVVTWERFGLRSLVPSTGTPGGE
jgi:hypothetical protein